MADGRARETLRQQRASFEQARRHGEAWFRLQLSMGYLAIAALVSVLGAALWIVLHPSTYGTVPVAVAATSLAGQVLALGFGVVRLVVGCDGEPSRMPRSHRPSDPGPHRALRRRSGGAHTGPDGRQEG